ncbi:MAG: ATP-grasp domain-containing protein [Candidatus Dojkabacteria bacterium]|jgi:glutathione synthase/RimK-type ligase-like ATP-grasp enzyme
MHYLILDKRQRVETGNKDGIPSASLRLVEELAKENIPNSLAYYDELEFEFIDGEMNIKVKREDIRKYTHIIFRGHTLDNEMEYHYKRYIIDYIDHHNLKNPDSNILVQNSRAIKKLPYYNKIALAIFCFLNDIPYFNTYFRSDGNYLAHRDVLETYPLIMKEYAGVNRLESVNGKEVIKKNVFKLSNEDDLRQEVLKDLNHSRFFIQQFADIPRDMRLFLKGSKFITGWVREAQEGFITVSKGKYSLYNNPTKEELELATKVAQKLDSDFLAVDIMHLNEKPLLQEISLHPGFKAYEQKTGGNAHNIAKEIITAFKKNKKA